MKDYIGKKFVICKKMCGVMAYKIVAFDEDTKLYIARDISTNFTRSYSTFNEKELESAIFDIEKFTNEIELEINEARKEFEKYSLITSKLDKRLFEHNLLGVCEGMRNVNAVQQIVDNFDKYFSWQKENYPDVYHRNFKKCKKEVKNFEKGIRRNKKVLYRILTKEEYDSLEPFYKPGLIDDINKSKWNLQHLERRKEQVIEKFDKYVK